MSGMPAHKLCECCLVECLNLEEFSEVTVNGLDMARFSPAAGAPLEYDGDPGYIAANLMYDEVWYLEDAGKRYFFSRNLILSGMTVIGTKFQAQVSTVAEDKGGGLECSEEDVLKLEDRYEMEIQGELYQAYI